MGNGVGCERVRLVRGAPSDPNFPRLAAAHALYAPQHDPSVFPAGPAYGAVKLAYRAELLPSLSFGQEWAWSKSWIGDLVGHKPIRSLFDHHMLLRLRGVRGPITWANVAVLGHPYSLFREDGINQAALDLAAELTSHGVEVWARPDLSSWYPSRTALVVAGQFLCDQDPAAFGFARIGAPA